MSIQINTARTNAALCSADSTGTAKTSGSGFSALFQDAVRKSGANRSMDDMFSDAASQYHVPVNLLKAVAKAESGFRADAVSSCGAQGIMQLMPSTALSLGVRNAFDPEENIMGGAKYLGGLLQSYGGDAKLALAAYNAGSGNVKKYGGIPPFRETQNYVQKVLNYAGGNLETQKGKFGSFAASTGSGSSISLADISEISFSSDDYRLFARMFVQQMEQEALDRASKELGAAEL